MLGVQMNWEAIGAIGEFLGAIAVVISLIYVAAQVRHNTRAIRTANATTVQRNFRETAQMFYKDREMGDIVLRAMAGEQGLKPADQYAAYAYYFDFLKTAELAHHQFLNGDLDPLLWEASLAFYKAYFSTPGFMAYWDERQSAFMPEFRKAMDTWVSEPGQLERPDKFAGVVDSGSGGDAI
jgi:hypothetical protein